MTALEPRPGFEWAHVAWERADEPPREVCSYCGDALDDDAVPLILFGEKHTARFCDHCQAEWWGIETFPDPPDDDEPDQEAAPDLGPCCMCEGSGARTLIMLDRRCAVPGHGWGCVVCGLPPDGASAVLCDVCVAIYETDPRFLTHACRGYPASDGRIPIADLPIEPFAHDEAKHRTVPG